MHAALPLWAIVLVVAALTPFLARAFARWVEHRARVRSERLLSLSTIASDHIVANEQPLSDRLGD